MRRKMISVLLAVSTAGMLFTGCGEAKTAGAKQNATEDKTADAEQSGGVFTGELEKNVTIQVLENDTAISKGYFEELINVFNEAYKDYGITAVDANMDQYLDLANDGPYGYGPDVLYQANDVIMQYAEGKHIYPLPVEKLECYDEIPDAAWDAYKVSVDGSTYTCGVPVNVQAPMLYYRADLLPDNWESDWDNDKNGVPDIIENFNSMYAFSAVRHAENPETYGYMKSLSDMYFSSGFLFTYGAYIFGEDNTDTSDIGFAAGDAKKGAWVLSQLASVMNEDCIDDTITSNAYSKLGDGTYFATISTPDVYSTFLDELTKQYETEGLSPEEAKEKAQDNLVMTSLPKLPKSGDLTEENPEWIDTKTMGGVNGYAVSAYTKAPNACLAFVDFATSYEMMIKRSEMLGIAPARADAADEAGGTSKEMFARLEAGNIILMPSVKEVSQIWTPGQTFFIDLAKDVFRPENEKKYKDQESMKTGLDDMSEQIYNAIFTLE